MCTAPLSAWRSKKWNPKSGKYGITFVAAEADITDWISVPCGRCVECRLEKRRQWAIRCMHEASMYDENSFVTLTYDDAHLPPFGSLDQKEPDDLQVFMKALRHKYARRRIRFFACGEYGEYGRPHYHLLLFNHDFSDKKRWSVRGDYTVFRSEVLEKLWRKGQSEIGEVTFESASYVAKYCMKDKDYSEDPLFQYYLSIGVWKPEFSRMSRRPGIGAGWCDEFKDEVLRDDSVIVNGREVKPPKYYMDRYEDSEYEKVEKIKAKRREGHSWFGEFYERAARDKIATAGQKLFKGGSL